MKRLWLIIALLLSMLVTALPAHAAGAATLHFSFTGQFAEAAFDNVDGCIETFVYVEAVDGRIKQTGHPEVISQALVVIEQFDNCAGVELMFALGVATLTPDQFQIDKKITTATLNATIEVTDFDSGNTFPVDVSVSWTGSGPTVTEKDRFHIKGPGFKVNSRFNGTFRDATASGTVSDGTTNFTPQPAFFADMGSVKQGEVDIIH